MAFTRNNVRDEVSSYLQDDARFLVEVDIQRMMDHALRQLNRDRPLMSVGDITGNASRDYDIESTLGFEKGFSTVRRVEFLSGGISQDPPNIQNRRDDWFVYEDPSKPAGQQLRLRFVNLQPSALDTIRVTLTKPFSLPKTGDSDLNQNAFNAVVYKVLNFGNRALADKFSQAIDPTIEADAVDRAGLTNNFLFVAERWETEYKRITGLSEPARAAQAIGDYDITFPFGEDLIWHGKRTH